MSYNREIVPYNGSRDRNRGENARYFALVNWGASAEDDGYVSLASTVVQSCERVALDARADVLCTLRYLGLCAVVVAVVVVVGYCVVQIVQELVVLLSRVLVDLPLGVVSALCRLVAPVVDLVIVQPVLGIGWVLHGVLWVIWSVLRFLFLCVSLPFGFLKYF